MPITSHAPSFSAASIAPRERKPPVTASGTLPRVLTNALGEGEEVGLPREAIRNTVAQFFELVPDLGFEPVSLRVGEDYWVAEWTMTGTSCTGAPVEIDLVDVVSVEDGLVAGKQSYVDGAAMQVAMADISA